LGVIVIMSIDMGNTAISALLKKIFKNQ